MDFHEYQKAARRTSGFNTGGVTSDYTGNLVCAALGLVGETGEFADYIKKHVYHGHMVSTDKIAEELGDVLWYLSELATAFSLSLDDIARHNVSKLQLRYPDGFSQERSINRTL